MKAVMMGGLALALGLMGAARAEDETFPSDTIIAIRQAGFDLQQGNASAMKAAVESGGSVKSFTDGAKGIASWARVIPVLFPDGSQAGHDTKAKPAIWSDRAGFEKDAANLATQADKLVTLAEADDKAGFAAQFKETGAACGACHRAYKNK